MDEELEEQVMTFVADETRTRRAKLSLETELLTDVGLDGQDAENFVARFAKDFEVDMASFRFGAHFGPEGLGCLPAIFLHALILRLRGRPTPRPIPITIRDLVIAAESGHWAARNA
jgi:hypothetical protein